MHDAVKTVVLSLAFVVGLATFAVTADKRATGVSRQLVGAAALANVPGHNLTAVTVELAPGVTIPPHQHAGFVFVYVLEGTVRSQLDRAPAVEYRTGESWMEPPGTVHALTQNPSATDKAKILAVFVAKEGAELTTMGKTAK